MPAPIDLILELTFDGALNVKQIEMTSHPRHIDRARGISRPDLDIGRLLRSAAARWELGGDPELEI